MRKFKKASKVRAVVQRINRKLAADGFQLRKSRGTRDWLTLGDFYVVDVERNFVVRHHLDLEDLARKVGALAAYETVAEES